VNSAETLVYSSAITRDNIEVKTAAEMKIPVIPRAEMLAELMRVKFSIAVAGTHGKTSTTSMIAAVLDEAGKDPTYVVGGKLKSGESGAKLGKSDFLVAEADESDGSFLTLFPTIAVITNIEDDHLDHYGNFNNLLESFTVFGNKVPFYGAVVLSADCLHSKGIIQQINKKVITFGQSPEADVRAVNIRTGTFESRYDLEIKGKKRGTVSLQVGGYHNVMNSLAAVAASVESEIELEEVIRGLSGFKLPDRRFQVLYRSGSLLVVDDYAHHPTEVKATLETLLHEGFGRIITVFQPHRFTRLEKLMEEFSESFTGSDMILVAKLYGANQSEIPGVHSGALADRIREKTSAQVVHMDDMGDLKSWLQKEVKKGDAVAFLSAGDLTRTAHEFAAAMEELNT